MEDLEAKLIDGTISEPELDLLYSWYQQTVYDNWNSYIEEKNPKRKEILRERRDKFEKRELDFLKLYTDFLIYKFENEEQIPSN